MAPSIAAIQRACCACQVKGVNKVSHEQKQSYLKNGVNQRIPLGLTPD